mmetsp:Transcript_103972/g.291253  ORF Transcript_103972/g.291253 Transcript_103972/m.291253 type:complete len:415 (-) Transcript_103972:785-2029(-)
MYRPKERGGARVVRGAEKGVHKLPANGGIFMNKPVVRNFFSSGSIVRGPVHIGTLKGSRPSSMRTPPAPRRFGKDLVMSTLPKADASGARDAGGRICWNLGGLPFSMGGAMRAGTNKCVVSLLWSDMNCRNRVFSLCSISSSTASERRFPSMFCVAPMARRCSWSRVRPYSSTKMPYNLSRIPSGNVSWWWMQQTAASKIACVSCGLSSRMSLAAGGPVLPKTTFPERPRSSTGFGAASGKAAETPAFAVWSAISSGVAMTSGKRISTAAVSRTASSCASFSASFLPARLLSCCNAGLLLAFAQARRCCASRSGGTSGTAMPKISSSLKKLGNEDVPSLRLCRRKLATKMVSMTTAKGSFDINLGAEMVLSILEISSRRDGSQEPMYSRKLRQEPPKARCIWSTMSSKTLSRLR